MMELTGDKVSLNGCMWRILNADERSVQTLMQQMRGLNNG